MTKKALLVSLLLLSMLLLLSSCGGNNAPDPVKTSDEIPVILSQGEYILYQNIFYNDYISKYDGIETKKEGILAIIRDEYSEVTRYYIWGYLDQTKCCDWQWEFVPDDPDSLPPPGSKIRVSGNYKADDAALDDMWIVNTKVETLVSYTGIQADLNMLAMSDTLERVQLASMMTHPDKFIGKQYIAYGRIYSPSELQDPYYDGSWIVDFESEEEMPAIGTIVVIQGVYHDGVLAEAKLLQALN